MLKNNTHFECQYLVLCKGKGLQFVNNRNYSIDLKSGAGKPSGVNNENEPPNISEQQIGLTTSNYFYNNSQIKLYPNPFSDFIKISDFQGSIISSVRIYDSMGKLVLQKKDIVDNIDTSNLIIGSYYVIIELENKQKHSFKMIKNN